MIGQFLFLKLKSSISELRNPLKIVVSILYLFMAVFYGYSIYALNEIDIESTANGNSTMDIFGVIYFSLGSLMILRTIFPSYTAMKQTFPNYLPISRFQNYCISLIIDFIKPFYLYNLIFLGTCSYLFQEISILLTGILIIICGQLARRAVQYPIDFILKKGRISPLISLSLLFVLIVLFHIFILNHLLLSLLFISCLLLIIGYLFEKETIINKKKKEKNGLTSGNIYIKLLINNKSVRKLLSVGFILKLVILGTSLITYQEDKTQLFEGKGVYWFFGTSLIIFTYVFNNYIGHWKNCWLNFELRSTGYKKMVGFILRLMILPLIIDMCITIPFLLYTWEDTQFVLSMYFTSMIYMISASIFWSLLLPINSKKLFNQKGNTSFLSITFSFLGVLLLSTMQYNKWLYAFIPFYILLSFAAIKIAFHLYEERKYKVFDKLFKES